MSSQSEKRQACSHGKHFLFFAGFAILACSSAWFYSRIDNTSKKNEAVHEPAKNKAAATPIVMNNTLGKEDDANSESEIKKSKMIAWRRHLIDDNMSIEQLRLDRTYAPLFAQLKLTTDEMKVFKDLLIELKYVKDNAQWQEMASENTGNANEDKKIFEKKNRGEITTDMIALLGDQRYEMFEYYEMTLPQRAMVEQIDLRLSYTAAPLSADQKDLLIDILHEETLQQGKSQIPVKDAGEQFKANVLKQAAQFLSESQIVSLKNNWNPRP